MAHGNWHSQHDPSRQSSSNFSSDDSQRFTDSDEPTRLVDYLANNYALTDSLRMELHTFKDVARGLPEPQLTVALIQQAVLFQAVQLLSETKVLCSETQQTVKGFEKAINRTEKLTTDQTHEVASACRSTFFNGRQWEFDNDAMRNDVMKHLEEHKDNNGLAVCFKESGKALKRALLVAIGRQLSYAKTTFRKEFLKAQFRHGQNKGTGVTALVRELGKKALGGSENVRSKHAMWCLLIRSFLRADPELQVLAAAEEKEDDAGGDENNDEAPSCTAPAKRTHSGSVKQAGTGKTLDPFWRRVEMLYKVEKRKFGSDLKSSAWAAYINAAVTIELRDFPSDTLSLVIVNASAPAAATTGPPTGRLSGLPVPRAATATPAHAATATPTRVATSTPGPSSRPSLASHHRTPFGGHGSFGDSSFNAVPLDFPAPSQFTLQGIPLRLPSLSDMYAGASSPRTFGSD